jgi:hypothetical protein
MSNAMNWNQVDWSLSGSEIAALMGVSRQHVYNVRNLLKSGLRVPRRHQPAGQRLTLDDIVVHECAVCKKSVCGQIPEGWIEFGNQIFCCEQHYQRGH